MKKLIATIIAVIALLAMTVPAMAVDTTVTVLSGNTNGHAPDIVASWVMVDTDSDPINYPWELGDDSGAPGTQIYPPLQWQTVKPVFYFALVDDREGDDDVVSVDVDVWHPQGSPYPYDQNAYFKYERPMCRFANYFGAQNPWSGAFEEFCGDYWFDLAVSWGLLTEDNVGINPNTGVAYTVGEICELIDQESVGFWCVIVWIDYEQPAGYYDLRIRAVDTQVNISDMNYQFFYIPVSMVEFDFSAIDFGDVMVNITQEIDGDRVFDTKGAGIAGYDGDTLRPSPAQATVRNIGNVWSKITAYQTNLYQGSLPLPNDPEWNVLYNACLSDPGIDNPKVYYGPYEEVTLTRNLYLSEVQKLDFSLKFMKFGQTGDWTGTLTLGSYLAPDWPTVLVDE